MKTEKVIKLGVSLGLKFDRKANYQDLLKRGTVVFDGCNGQRFLIESSWLDEEILSNLGQSLMLVGRREKAMEINKVLSINEDY